MRRAAGDEHHIGLGLDPAARVAVIGGYILIVEWTRALAATIPGAAVPAILIGGGALAGSAVADELLLIEMELMRDQRRRPRTARSPSPTAISTSVDPAAQKTREKIVRALRKKK